MSDQPHKSRRPAPAGPEPDHSERPVRPRRSPARAGASASSEATGDETRAAAISPPHVVRRKKRRRPRTEKSGPPLISALWYPLQGMGPLVLAAYSILLWMTSNVGFPLVQMIAVLLVCAAVGLLFLEIANFTLEGIPSGLRFFEIGWESISVGMYAMVAVLISRLPHVIGVYAMQSAGSHSPVLELLLIAAGMYYLPMAIMALADTESERGLNPIVVFRGIGRMAGPYFGLVTLAVAAFLIPAVLMWILQAHPLVIALVTPLLMLYIGAALVRAIALVYRRRAVNLSAG